MKKRKPIFNFLKRRSPQVGLIVLLLLLFQFINYCAFAQSKKVDGTVRDTARAAIAGVTVSVKNTNSATSTDNKGNYSISVPGNNAVLIFSHVGMGTKEILVGEKSIVDVTLSDIDVIHDEVVVVAFGRQKKASTVGSQSTIKVSELKIPAANLTTAIAGRLAGVVATQRSGAPGNDGATLLIRGVATFSSSPRGPLLVVDGVPDRNISDIDPEDIESFTILKDATATAVYGTRGANGVILINSKAGKSGAAKVNFEINRGVTRFTFLPEFVDAPTFMELYNEGLIARGSAPFYTEEKIAKHKSGEDPDLYPNVNWFKEIFNDNGSNSRVTMNITGGSDRFKYYTSVGYFNEIGLTKREELDGYNSTLKLDRFNFTSNLDINISKDTKMELGVTGFLNTISRPPAGIDNLFNLSTQAAPHIVPKRYSNGQWSQLRGSPPGPYIFLVGDGITDEYNNTVRSNVKLSNNFKFIEGLKGHALFAFDVFSGNNITRSRRLPTYYATGRDSAGALITVNQEVGSDALNFGITRTGSRRVYFEAGLNYSRSFGDHDVSGLLLFNQSIFNDGTGVVTSYIASLPYKQRNYVGRATYGYKNRYFAEANFSYSASDNFIPSKRYGFFPSFGAGWIVSNESFFDAVSRVIPKFKLRYSYGLTGNAAVNDPNARFLYLTKLAQSGGAYSFGGPGSLTTFTGYAENLIEGNVTWETGYKQNLGIELNFLKNELQLIVELYKENRKGILLRENTVPLASGFTQGNLPYGNVGETKNKGIDISLDYNHTFKSNTFITFKGTFNANKNIVVNDGNPLRRYSYQNTIGQSIGQRFALVDQGLFQSQEEIDNGAVQSGNTQIGDIRFKDLNGDGLINHDDITAVGYGDIPLIVYGLTIGGGMKGFDISFFFQGVSQVDFNYAGGFSTIPFKDGASWGNVYKFATDRWQAGKGTNQTPFYPRLSTNQDINMNYQTNSWWVQRADYLRLKFAEFGYNFNSDGVLKHLNISRVRVYLNGTNLFTFSPWKFWDPELGNGTGIRYPQTAVYNIGARINFK